MPLEVAAHPPPPAAAAPPVVVLAPAAVPAPIAAPIAAPVPAAPPASVPAASKDAHGDARPGKPDDGTLQSRLLKLESSFAALADLRDMSELLSVRYNPFLEKNDISPEERHTASDYLRAQLGHGTQANPQAPAANERAGAVPAHPTPPLATHPGSAPPAAPIVAPPMPEAALAAPAPPSSRVQGIAVDSDTPVGTWIPAVPVPSEARPAPAPLPVMPILSPPPVVDQPFGAGGMRDEPAFFATSRAAGGPREAFLAIHWFTYLSQGTDPSVIFAYLDYYRSNHWLTTHQHTWLESLASGLAHRKTNAQWSDYGLSVERLAQNHLRNLRFLDKLFGTTLQYGEAQYLQQPLDVLLQGD